MILHTFASKWGHERVAEFGDVRAIPRCPTEDKDTVLRWLDRYAEIGRKLV